MGRASDRSSWTPTRVIALSCIVAFVASIALALVARPDALEPPLEIAMVALIAAVPLACGALIARGAPRHPAGALLCVAGLTGLATNAVSPDRLGPFEGTWMLIYLPFALVLLVVPSGAPSRARRALGWAITLVTVSFVAVVGAAWSAPGITALDVVALGLLAAFFIGLLLCAASPFVTYRGAGEHERMQLRWVILAAATLPITLLLCWTSYLLLGGPDLVGIGLVLVYVLIPAGVAVGVLRPALFDVDRLAVGTSAVTALAVSTLLVLSLASALTAEPVSAWPTPVALVVLAVLTALSAACFPLVHRFCDRVIYPERARAVAALRDFSRRVDRGESAPEDLVDVLRGALRDPALILAYRRIGDGTLVTARSCTTVDAAPLVHTSPVRVRGEDIGAVITSRTKRPSVAVIQVVAPLIDLMRTRAELSQAKNDVEASRRRILRAGYDERRRLERDLHDGAQQRLVALGMRLRVLQRTTSTDASVAALLDTAVAELATAVAELRRLAQGVRPSALDDGIGPALAALTQELPTPVELDVDVDAHDLPDAVGTTVYFVVSEAVTNALKHAAAARVRVSVHGGRDVVRVRVEDDGIGGAAVRPTGGLESLGDRVAALGGRIHVMSPPGVGTTIEAVLPCVS